MKRFSHFVESTFGLKENGYESKIISLEEAIRQNIKPGMKLHIAGNPNAALRELIRQYQGKAMEITLISSGIMTAYEISLVYCGLVRKIITSICSYIYPTPAPIPLIQKACKEKTIEIESWSLYALEQRLMAAALGVGFMPTKSILGTSMAEENKHSFIEIEDPFGGGERIGLVKALAPDLSIVHGCVADKYGNTILAPPYYTSIWGPRASKNGVIVTVEEVVSTDFIREHANMVKLFGYLVNSVCVVPTGSHPQGLAGIGLGGIDSYAEDYDFNLNYRVASKEPALLDTWIKEWVLDCRTQKEYLQKLGQERILSLKERASRDAWRCALESSAKSISTNEECNEIELMIIAAAREIMGKVRRNGYKTMLAGAGISGLAAWVAYYLLQREKYDIDLAVGTGQYGYAPRPLDPSLDNVPNVETCKAFADTIEIYGLVVGGKNNKCLAVLGAAQIDKHGNINTLKIDDIYFAGAGGADDAANAREVVVVSKQSRERLLDKVTSISCPGSRVEMLVTSLGILEKVDDSRELTLTKYFENPKLSTEENIRNVKENCGWDLRVAKNIEGVSPPTLEELLILRLLDPQKFFIKG